MFSVLISEARLKSVFARIARWVIFCALVFGAASSLGDISGLAFGATRSHAESLPTYSQFVRQLPHYSYECDVQDFFANANFRRAMGVTSVPANREFNARLADLIPRVLYESIARLSILNPEYAADLFSNAYAVPLRFVCTHFLASIGTESFTMRHFFFFGEKTINLGALVLDLLNTNYATSVNRSSRQGMNKLEALDFRVTLFHEFLHADSFKSGFLKHSPKTVRTGGEHDIVYSCSQFAWPLSRPMFRHIGEKVGTIKATSFKQLRRDVRPYTAVSYTSERYFKFFDKRRRKSLLRRDPQSALVRTFTYSKCMTCAMARVYDGIYFESHSKRSENLAERTCSRMAPKFEVDIAPKI